MYSLFKNHVTWVMDAHQNYSRTNEDKIRFWDKKTPYWIHPVWCGMTILTETNLPDEIRIPGAIALLYHDLLEDTNKQLPKHLSMNIKKLILDMTFSSFQEEVKEVWDKSDVIILLKLYDKTSNLLDAIWMEQSKLIEYKSYTKKLFNYSRKKFPKLNIYSISRLILE